MSTYAPAEVFPPGEFLRDELDARGWTATEFAEIIGRPVQVVSEILNDKKAITTETAIELGDALGTSPEMWLKLQMQYRLHQQRATGKGGDPLTDVQRRSRLRNLVPLAEVRKRRWIPDTLDLDEAESAVRTLLEIEDLESKPTFAVAARRSNAGDAVSSEQRAWLARVRQVARKRPTTMFDRDGLAQAAEALPRLLRDGPPALAQVPDQLESCGVTFIVLEGLRGGKLDGSAIFVDGDRAVIALTGRFDRFDSFLFTLLHECAHLSLGHITEYAPAILDEDVAASTSDPVEVEASEQALRWVFPTGLTVDGSESVGVIARLAAEHGVHPSVVIGQVQRRSGNWSRFRTKVPKVKDVLAAMEMMS